MFNCSCSGCTCSISYLIDLKKKITNNKKIGAAPKIGEGGDDQHVYFFTWPNNQTKNKGKQITNKTKQNKKQTNKKTNKQTKNNNNNNKTLQKLLSITKCNTLETKRHLEYQIWNHLHKYALKGRFLVNDAI